MATPEQMRRTVKRFAIDRPGPTSLLLADLLEERIQEKKAKTGFKSVAESARTHAFQFQLVFEIASTVEQVQEEDKEDDLGGLDSRGVNDSTGSEEPLWYILDAMLARGSAAERRGTKRHPAQHSNSGHDDESWQRFWKMYRKKATLAATGTSAPVHDPSTTSDPRWSLVASHLMSQTQAGSTAASARASPKAVPPVPLAQAGGGALRGKVSPPNTRTSARSRDNSLRQAHGAAAHSELLLSRTGMQRAVKATARRGSTRSNGNQTASSSAKAVAQAKLSSMSQKILEEHKTFEEWARRKSEACPRRTGRGPRHREGNSEDELSMSGFSGSEDGRPESPGFEPRRRSGAGASEQQAACGLDGDDFSRGSPESEAELAMARATARSSVLPVAAVHSRHFRGSCLPQVVDVGLSPQAHRNALIQMDMNGLPEDLSTRRETRLKHCFAGFEDYKRRQITPVEHLRSKADAKLREVLQVETKEPCWQWSLSMQEHKTARSWRLRDELSEAKQGIPEISSPRIPKSARGKARPQRPDVDFHRPWSREGRESPSQTSRPPTSSSVDDSSLELDPLMRFAKVCLSTGVHPQPASIRFLTARELAIDVRAQGYSDEDLLALTASLPSHGTLEAADLGENPRLTDPSVMSMMNVLAKKHPGIRALRLDHCPRLGKGAIDLCTKLMLANFRELQVLDISGISIGIQEYKDLATAVEVHMKIRDVRLSGTGLGLCDKTLATTVVAHLVGNPRLVALDLGWNSLDVPAFETLGKCLLDHNHLAHLGLANSGMVVDPVLGGSPVMAFLELISGDSTVEKLDLSNNGLDGHAALVLESALLAQGHPRISRILISDNPLGLSGMRCLLRILAHHSCPELCYIVAHDINGASIPSQFNGPFDGDPSGHYHLELLRPSHRALLRLLIQRVMASVKNAFNTYIRRIVFLRQGVEVYYQFEGLKRAKNGAWEVPGSGDLSFEVVAEDVVLPPKLKSPAMTPTQAVEEMLRQARMKVDELPRRKELGLLSFVKGTASEQERSVVLQALGSDFVLMPEQVKALCYSEMKGQNTGKDPVGSCSRLLAAAIGSSNMRMAACCTTGLTDFLRLEKAAWHLLSVDLENPTGHYDLNLSEPADRSTAERLLLLNRWQWALWRDKGRLDVSRFGNAKNFRNESLNGRAFTWPAEEWRLPVEGGGGSLVFDFVSLHRPPKNSAALEPEVWSKITERLREVLGSRPIALPKKKKKQPAVEEEGQVPDDASQGGAPDPVAPKAAGLPAIGSKRTAKIQATSKARSVAVESPVEEVEQPITTLSERNLLWVLKAISSRYYFRCGQLRELLCFFRDREVRSDCLVYLFLRCVDWPLNAKLVRPKFTEKAWRRIRKRIGHINLFLVFQPENVFVSLDLSVLEEKRILHSLLRLAQAEHPTNLKRPRIDWTGGGNWDSFVSGIPLSWDNFDVIPNKGVFEATYMCSMEFVRLRSRRRLAGSGLCGWTTMPEEPAELAKELHFWAVLDDVPNEVVRVLVFLVGWAPDLKEAFRRCDASNKGCLNHKEFVHQLALAGCCRPVHCQPGSPTGKPRSTKSAPKSQAKSAAPSASGVEANSSTKESHAPGHADDNKEQIDALTQVYRYLDTTNDGDISKKEFETLEAIWREMWQSMFELKTLLCDCLGGLTEVWQAFDREDEDHMVFAEFEKLVLMANYDGPTRQIYMYLDADNDERISLEEWLHLDKVGNELKQPKWR
eukprot:TRINITY_DN5576_c0_g1_i2.p1 TRINITY_DN5576_c0_g1~~TRINITY_DN5576_c0_g1_i2.p1  ORF type:complete len:1720 (-),score=341.75 TRINITY_DN5576_c0_g1_i2:98-5257(-)